MDNKIEWIEKEFNGKKEVFALRRSFDGWRVVYPMKNQNGTYNWKNIVLGGSWGNAFRWLMILALILLFFYVYNHDTSVCRETMEHFGENCQIYLNQIANRSNNLSFGLPQINISFKYGTP